MSLTPPRVLPALALGLSLLTPVVLVAATTAGAAPAAADPMAGVVALVNVGGPALVDGQGRRWLADTYGSGGTVSWSPQLPVSPTPAVDRDDRYGTMRYSVPVPDAATYTVRLHLTEPYWSGPGKRVFDVLAEGVTVVSRVDVHKEVGKDRTHLVDVQVPVRDGRLDLLFQTVVDNAAVSGIEVLRAQPGTSPAPAPAPAPAVAEPVALVNVGGPALVDGQGRRWLADTYGSGGTVSWSPQLPVSPTPAVDRDDRYGTMRYSVPVPDAATYTVRLHLTEPYWSGPGKRVFDVLAEGVTVVSRVDVHKEVGKDRTHLVDVQVPVRDGRLDLLFQTVVDNAAVSGIEVLRAQPGTSPVPAPAPVVRPAPVVVAPPVVVVPPVVVAPPVAAPPVVVPPVVVTAPLPATPSVPVEAYGAVGDGRTDDTAALQRAFDSVPRGTDLVLAAGRTYTHSDVLHVRRAGTRLRGPGSLLATNEARSSLWVEADDVVLDGVTLRISGTTRRWEAWEQMRLRAVGRSGLVLRDVTVDGSAAAGIYLGGASGFLLERVTVKDTRADGIHMTSGSRDGRVVSPTVVGSGDDGVAVISYEQDGEPCRDIIVTSPRVLGTTWGRGLTVVGGRDITYTDVYVERSSAAAVYVGSEGAPWFTAAPVRVRVTGGTLVGSNTSTTVDHGAVVVLSGGRTAPDDVRISGLTIKDTRSSASRSVGVITYGQVPRGVVLEDFRVQGGPRSAYSGNTAPQGYSTLRWTVDGQSRPDHVA